MKKIAGFITLAVLLSACNQKKETITITPDDLHAAVDQVTEIMIHDIFSPPVASRIYVYPNITAYEIMAVENNEYKSLAGQLRGLTPIPQPDASKKINYSLSALIAHMDMSRRLIFSEDRMKAYRDSLYGLWESKNP